MIKGFDCFGPVSDKTLDKAKKHGYKFVARYYGTTGSQKLLLPDEVKRVSDAGLKLFSVFEKTTGRPLDGRAAGEEDGKLALKQAAYVKQPEGSTICFAVDTDVDMTKAINRNMIHAYFKAASVAIGNKYKIGAYGGGDVLDYLLNENLIKIAWLAGAMGWQGSRKFDTSLRWHIKQYPTVKGGDLGIEYDPNDAIDLDKIGSWSLMPSDDSSLVEIEAAIASYDQKAKSLQIQLKSLGYYDGKIDGDIGPLSRKALSKYWAFVHQKDNPK